MTEKLTLEWVGLRLDERAGTRVGRVEGVYVDAEDGSPQWLLVRIGRFGHHTLLPFPHAAAGVDRAWVAYDRDTIRGAPRVEAGGELTREAELELCAHFGIPQGIGRAAELRGRDPELPTARLAAA
jgi:hypothetical protein